MEDPAASVKDPALGALVREGWTIGAHLPAQKGNQQQWLLLMMPPSSTAESPTYIKARMVLDVAKTVLLLLIALTVGGLL